MTVQEPCRASSTGFRATSETSIRWRSTFTAAHSLNLSVTDACTVAPIRNYVGILGNICTFFSTSAKRCDALKTSIDNKCPDSSATHLKQLCPTRWVDWHDSVLLFVELMEAVGDCLSAISSWSDIETSTKANQLHCAMENPEFIVSLHVLIGSQVFAVSMPLSRLLQTENMDLAEEMNLASHIETTLKTITQNAEQEFSNLFGTVEATCETLNVALEIPLRAGRQTHRNNRHASTPEEYFRAAIYIPFLDNFIAQPHDRLVQHKCLLQSFRCLLPHQLESQPTTSHIEAL